MATFNIWDYRGGNYDINVSDLPAGYTNWGISVDASRFKTAAVVFNGWSNSGSLPNVRELRLIDLETGRIMAGRQLQPTEIFLPSMGADTAYHLAQVSNGALVVRAYDYSLAANASSLTTPVGTPLSYLPPAGESTSFFNSIWRYTPPTGGSNTAYFQGTRWNEGSNEPLLYKAVNAGQLQAIPMPVFDSTNAWVSDVLVDSGFLWLQLGFNDRSGPDRNAYYKLSLSNSAPTPSAWQAVDDVEDYWDVWDRATGGSSVVRDGAYAYDLAALVPQGTMIWVSEEYNRIVELPGGKLLVRAEMEVPSTNPSAIDVGYEHWFIFANGSPTPIAQKAFTGLGQVQWSTRAPEDGYIYFEVINATFQRSGNDVIGISQPASPASTLYRIALADVESVIASVGSNATLVASQIPGVQQVMSFSQSQLAGGNSVGAGQVTAIDGFVPVGNYKAGDMGVLVSSVIFDPVLDIDRFFISRIEANGTVTKVTEIRGEINEVVIDDAKGVFFRAEEWKEDYSEGYHIDFTTGQVTQIPEDYFWQIDDAEGLPNGVVFAAGNDVNNTLGSATQTAPQWLAGGNGADTLTGGRGNDMLAGGEGLDTAVFTGNRANYEVQRQYDGKSYQVKDLRTGSPDGTDRVYSVERLQFADGVTNLSYADFYGVDLNGDEPGTRSDYSFSPFSYWGGNDWTDTGYSRSQPNPFWNAKVGLDSGIKAIVVQADKAASDLSGVSLDWRFDWHGTIKATGELEYNAPVMRFGENAAPKAYTRWIDGTQYSFTASVESRTVSTKTYYDLRIESSSVLPNNVWQEVVRGLGIEYRNAATQPANHDIELGLTVKVSADGTNFIGAQTGQAGTTIVELTNKPPELFQALHSGNAIGLFFTDGELIDGDLARVMTDQWVKWMGHPAANQFQLEVTSAGVIDTSYSVQAAYLEQSVYLLLNKPIAEGASVRVKYTDPAGDQVKNVVQTWDGVDAASSNWMTSRYYPGDNGRALDGAVLGIRLNSDFPFGTYVADADNAGLQLDPPTPGRVTKVNAVSGVTQSFEVEFKPTQLLENPRYSSTATAGTFTSYRYSNEVVTLELSPLAGQSVTVGQVLTPLDVFSATNNYQLKSGKLSVVVSNNPTATASDTVFHLADWASRDGQAYPLTALISHIPFAANQFIGTPLDDKLWGGFGNDTLNGGAGTNELYGGFGNDTLTGDRLGRSQVDWNQAFYRDATASISVTLGSANGTSTVGTVVGNSAVGTDTLINIDEVVGTDFNDTYTAHANWRGGQFRTYFSLLPGEITNPDTVLNSFVPGKGNDAITGNGYTRLAYWDATTGGINVNFSASVAGSGTVNATAAGLGTDTFTGVNAIRATGFNDTLVGGAGNQVFRPMGGNDYVDGGAGIDVVEYIASREGVRVDLRITGPQLISASEGTDTLLNIERVAGSEFGDELRGTDASNEEFYGRGGDDYINGREGNNWLDGGAGNDTLTGGTRGINRIDWNAAGYSRGLSHGIEVVLGSANNSVTTGNVRARGSMASEIGVDSLENIDAVRGTNKVDTYIAHDNWRGGQLNAFDFDTMFGQNYAPWIFNRALNEFRGAGGNDTITGNDFTRINYRLDALPSAGITVNYTGAGTGTVTGTDLDGAAFTHTFSRVQNVRTTTGNDTLRAAQGGNVVFQLEGGADTIEGSTTGVTMADYRFSDVAVSVDLGKTAAQAVNNQGWSSTLTNVRGLRGSEFADTLKGGAANEWFAGGAGNDTIDGGAGSNTVIYGGLLSEYTITGTTTLSVIDNRTGQFNDGTDTLTNIQKLRFADQDFVVGGPTPPPPPPVGTLSGKVYHWKTGALLSGVEVEATALAGGGTSGTKLFEFREATLTGSNFSAELWVNLDALSVENLDLTLGFGATSAVSFTLNSAVLGWSLFDNSDQLDGVRTLTVAGFASSEAAALSGSVRLGVVSATLNAGVTKLDAGFLSGEAGNKSLSPYSLSYGAFKDTTGTDGAYDLSGLSPGSVLIDAFKALGTGETGSVISSADALAALKIAVGRNPNSDNSAVSPYQFISADVNGSGTVTSADALAVLKMAVKRSDAPAREWIFVDEMRDFWNEGNGTVPGAFTTTRTSLPKPENLAIVVDPALRGGEVNLVAMLKGDVNGSWAAPLGSTLLPDSYFTNLATLNPNIINIAQFG